MKKQPLSTLLVWMRLRGLQRCVVHSVKILNFLLKFHVVGAHVHVVMCASLSLIILDYLRAHLSLPAGISIA